MVQESIKHFPIPLRKSLKAIAEGDFLEMPIYEYDCLNCNLKFDYLIRSSNDSVVCPRCNSKDLRRLVSNFAFSSKDRQGTITNSSSGCGSCASQNCSTCSG